MSQSKILLKVTVLVTSNFKRDILIMHIAFYMTLLYNWPLKGHISCALWIFKTFQIQFKGRPCPGGWETLFRGFPTHPNQCKRADLNGSSAAIGKVVDRSLQADKNNLLKCFVLFKQSCFERKNYFTFLSQKNRRKYLHRILNACQVMRQSYKRNFSLKKPNYLMQLYFNFY